MTPAQERRYFEGVVQGVNLGHPTVDLVADVTPYHFILNREDGEEIAQLPRLMLRRGGLFALAVLNWIAAVVTAEELNGQQSEEDDGA